MKELRVTIKVRNNRLIAAREELGWSQTRAAQEIGISNHTLGLLETLQRSPVAAGGGWGETALKIAAFYGHPPEYLWPELVQQVRRPLIERCLSYADLPGARLGQGVALLPDESLDTREAMELLYRRVAELPLRERMLITNHFGLHDQKPQIFAALEEGTSSARARQVLEHGLALLRRGIKFEDADVLEPLLENLTQRWRR